jgi:hypothetical protein
MRLPPRARGEDATGRGRAIRTVRAGVLAHSFGTRSRSPLLSSATSVTQTRTKGTNFRSFASAFKRLRGDDAFARALDLLAPDLAEGVRVGAIVSGSWYSIAWYDALHAAAQKACNEGHELSREIARAGIKEDLASGVYRLVTLSLAPQSIFKWSQRVVGLYYDRGRCIIEEAVPGRVMGRFEGFTGFTRNLWEDMIGGSLGAMEIAGAKGLQPRILSGGGDGDAHMGLVMKWTA